MKFDITPLVSDLLINEVLSKGFQVRDTIDICKSNTNTFYPIRNEGNIYFIYVMPNADGI